MNILLIQPDWKTPNKIKMQAKYYPLPLIKIAGYERAQGNNVHLVIGNEAKDIPFTPDRIYITTVFSWFFDYVRECADTYHFLYPNSEIVIGGIHASMSPELYRKEFPYARIHVGRFDEADKAEPAYDLAPEDHDIDILSFSTGCVRRCSFCYVHKIEPYEAFKWDEVAPKIRHRKLILNDNNILFHPHLVKILKNLATFKVGKRNLSSVEVQGGLDVRVLSKRLSLVPLLKDARFNQIRLAFDQGLEMWPMVEKCIDALDKGGFNKRDIRIFCLYNYELPFETILKKIKLIETTGCGIIHSRYRPMELLRDGYVPQKKAQTSNDYYIHTEGGWTDKKVRVVGSLCSDVSRMARAGVDSLDSVREYYGRPSFEETVKLAQAA